MILSQCGAIYVYEDTEYTIGMEIIGNMASEYEGLRGHIYEIRDGDDKDTENETPDIYCRFERPTDMEKIVELEKRFSGLYSQPMTIDEIIVDDVIMAPDMIEPVM